MPRSADQNETLRATTRAKLLAAALSRFARDGYAESSVKTVAADAGVATGMLYSHFDGKDGMLKALFEESMHDVRASFAVAESAAPAGRLAALVRACIAIVREHLDFWRLSYAARTQPAVIAALGPALDEWTASILAALSELLAARGSPDPELDARVLFAQIDGVCQHFALHPEGYPIDAVADRVIARWTATVL